jgi:AcrR family transcriptional regulator
MPASNNARARVRAELSREIKAAARAELVGSGAAGLSLRAVARRIDMVPSALYRYFDGRDALLTALIVDAYASIARVAEAADRDAGPSPEARWLAIGRAIRAWAGAHPSEWSLVYGSPVPDYDAPAETIEVGTAVVRLLLRLLLDAHPTGDAALPVTPQVSPALHAWLARIREPGMDRISDRLLTAGVYAFTFLLGAISVELFGQFGKEATPAPEIFDAGMVATGRMLALAGEPAGTAYGHPAPAAG